MADINSLDFIRLPPFYDFKQGKRCLSIPSYRFSIYMIN
jgi:hypothetical protein